MKNLITKLISFIAVCLIVVVAANAQSTNPSSPTPLAGEYSGKGPSKETNYYFSFTAGPGDVSVSLDIKAKDYSTFARIEIGNDPSNLIAMHNMNASTTTGPATVTKQFKLQKEQSVRIKLTLDGNLAEYKLSLTGGGGSFESGGGSTNTGGAKTGIGGKIGKVTTGSGSKIGSSGEKPKFGTQGSTGNGGSKLSFTCPNEVMYKIVPNGEWNPTLFSQKRFLFEDAGVDGSTLSCTYKSITGSDGATLIRAAPVGYACTVYKGGSKSRDFSCTTAATALLIPRMETWQLVMP